MIEHTNSKIMRYRKLPALLRILPVVLLVFFSACKEEKNPTGIIFDHQQHLGRGYSCGLCHLFFSYVDPSRPRERVCALCHDVGNRKEPAIGVCSKCHTRTDLTSAGLPRPDFDDSKFHHKQHEKAGLSCTTCHRNQEKARTYENIVFPAMEDCRSCHVRKPVASECETCHRTWRKDKKPESHDIAWGKTHGGKAVEEFEGQCAYCHSKSQFCQECHMAEPPKSHTLFFRNRGHGSQAETNRMECLPCHQQDFCLACHGPGAGVKPLTHTAAFGGRRPYLHCVTCHFPGGEAYGCSACHQAGVIAEKHLEGTDILSNPIPDFVTQISVNCLNNCHPFQTIPVLHPLGGFSNNDCVRCHIP